MSKEGEAKTMLVTGASSGIGRALCRQLLRQKHNIVVAGRDLECLSEIYKDSTAKTVRLNLSKPGEVADIIGEIIKRQNQQASPIDCYIACGGYGQFGGLEQFSYAQIEELMNVNFTSHAIITRALLPDLKRLAGHIVFMGSEAALAGTRNGAIYCASKFAVRGFAQALRDESARSGLRVGIVNPGMVDTPFFDELGFAPGDETVQHIRADDVADAVMLMLNQPKGTVIDEINMSPLNKVIRNK